MDDINQYLDFEDPSEPENSDSEIVADSSFLESDELNFTEEDFAKLARTASGIEEDNPSEPEIEAHSEDILETSSSSGLKRPPIKIIAGLFMTSLIVVALIAFRGSWLKIFSLRPEQTESSPESSENKYLSQIDKLKAELASVEQNRKPIVPQKPLPPQKPQPQPQPKSSPPPKPQPKPKPIPKTEPIDPYEQWAKLSQLGTLGNSSRIDTPDLPDSEESTTIVNPSNKNQDNSKQNSPFSNPSISQNPGLDTVTIGQPSTPEPDSKFSREQRKMILNSLGISSNSLPDSPQIDMTKSFKGSLATKIAWTNNSNLTETTGSIILSEPLSYADDAIAIPVGSSIIVRVADWDNSGFVTLEAIAISYEQQGQLQQTVLPPGALIIRALDNQPLAFQSQKNNGENINHIAGNFVQEGVKHLPLPKELSSTASRAILNSSRSSIDNTQLYFLEAQTPVLVQINRSFLGLNP